MESWCKMFHKFYQNLCIRDILPNKELYSTAPLDHSTPIFVMVQPQCPNTMYPTKLLHAPLELQSLLLRSHLTLDT